MNTIHLHERDDFRNLIEITAAAEGINDPALVEKDYWLMHVLWGLQKANLTFELKGGTSLSKGFNCIYRFSEDIDIKIVPNEEACGFHVYTGENHDGKKHRESRKEYFQWICSKLEGKIPGIGQVVRDAEFDDKEKFRNGGIRLFYDSPFLTLPGLKEGILLELGFARTAPNRPLLITSWAYERARAVLGDNIVDNRAVDVLCYEPKYTFVEKLQAVIRKYRMYREDKTGKRLPINFIRHYYDLYYLLEREEVRSFLGTPDYENYKKEWFKKEDTKVSNSEAFKLSSASDRAVFEDAYARSAVLYYRERPSLQEILNRMGTYLDLL